MRFHQKKYTLVQIVSAMLVCALLLLTKHIYVRYRFDERTASRLRQVAVELEKLVQQTSLGERVAQGHAEKALTHVIAVLGQHHVETPYGRLKVMRKIGTKKLAQMPLVVCPENYLGIDDYQPSEKRPAMANCSDVPPFSSVLSILINGFDYTKLGFSTSWVPYNPGTYIKCPTPGSHMCLDRYLADGNIDFLYQ